MLDARKQRSIEDAPGSANRRPIPKGDALLAAGTANQTKLSGGPVRRAAVRFAPTAGEYLRTHLFGDIFERDNLDWQSRRLATVGMLSALPRASFATAGAHAHQHERGPHGRSVANSPRCWLREWMPAARRASAALDRHLATTKGKWYSHPHPTPARMGGWPDSGRRREMAVWASEISSPVQFPRTTSKASATPPWSAATCARKSIPAAKPSKLPARTG